MNLTREILNSSPEQLMERLVDAQGGSEAWLGITAELQRRRLIDLNAALERSEKLSLEFVHQMDRLISVSEAQKILATGLDRQTVKLIRLTYVLVFLTFILLLFTAQLSYDAYKKDKDHDKPGLNDTKPK